MPTQPIVRHFLACLRDNPGTPVERLTLADIVPVIDPAPGEGFPAIVPDGVFCLYAVLSSGRGLQRFAVRVYIQSGLAPTLVWEAPVGIIDLGNDPLAVYEWPIELGEFTLSQPGQYEFVLVCDGAEVASVYIEMRR